MGAKPLAFERCMGLAHASGLRLGGATQHGALPSCTAPMLPTETTFVVRVRSTNYCHALAECTMLPAVATPHRIRGALGMVAHSVRSMPLAQACTLRDICAAFRAASFPWFANLPDGS
jgi:hypothetical protein